MVRGIGRNEGRKERRRERRDKKGKEEWKWKVSSFFFFGLVHFPKLVWYFPSSFISHFPFWPPKTKVPAKVFFFSFVH